VAKAMSSKAAMTMPTKASEGAKQPGSILRCSPVAYGLHLDSRSFAPPDKHIIASDSDLQGSAEESPTDNGSFGSFGKPHIGKTFSYFLAYQYPYNLK
jgi:hypothetical protein